MSASGVVGARNALAPSCSLVTSSGPVFSARVAADVVELSPVLWCMAS